MNPRFGYMWALNTNRRLYPSVPENSYCALGAGGNILWIDPKHDLVVAVRWLDWNSDQELMKRVLAAVKEESSE